MAAPKRRRAFTTIELLISMVIMGIILALAVVEFAMVFNHNNLTNANLTAEQNARIAMAMVNNEFRQAMPNETDYTTPPYPMVISPTPPPPSTAPAPVSQVTYWKVHNGPGGLASPIPTNANGEPVPCYDQVTLSYDPVAQTITRTAVLQTNTNCSTASTVVDVIAYHVTNFAVTPLDQKGTLFQLDIQTLPSKGSYGTYDLQTQVLMGYKP
jgi:prepilin-type N-terminal cleavage/methylation domain-containing protein